jgi:hypothetical protein
MNLTAYSAIINRLIYNYVHHLMFRRPNFMLLNADVFVYSATCTQWEIDRF